jgi:hypothetical protein
MWCLLDIEALCVLVKMFTMHFMFQMFESPSLDAEMTDDTVQPSTSEVQSQVSKTPSPKKMPLVSTIHFLRFCDVLRLIVF